MLGKTHVSIGAMTGALLLSRLDLPKQQLEVPPIISLMFPSLTFNTLENFVTAMIGIGVSAFAARVVDLDSPQASLTREITPIVLLSRRITLLVMAIVLWCFAFLGWLPFTTGVILSGWIGLCALSKHRSLTHSLVGLTLASIGVFYIHPSITIAFGVGYASHILADLVTEEGVPLFWPYPKKFHLRWLRTGSPIEAIFRLVANCVTIYVIIGVVIGQSLINELFHTFIHQY